MLVSVFLICNLIFWGKGLPLGVPCWPVTQKWGERSRGIATLGLARNQKIKFKQTSTKNRKKPSMKGQPSRLIYKKKNNKYVFLNYVSNHYFAPFFASIIDNGCGFRRPHSEVREVCRRRSCVDPAASGKERDLAGVRGRQSSRGTPPSQKLSNLVNSSFPSK